MPEADYEYRGLIVSCWDLLRGDTSGWSDRTLFRDLILRSGQPALDVGCATGRLILDYLAQGLDVDGVDCSPEMLALCRQKADQRGLRPTLYRQEMERLDLPRRYRTILVPSSTFQLVTDPAEAAEVMRRLFEHLEPGGTLAMPFMVLWTGAAETNIVVEDWKLLRERTRPGDGALVRRWTRSTLDLTAQLEHTEDRYEVLRDSVVIEAEDHARSPATRWYRQDEAIGLYCAAGFAEVQALHGFTWEPTRPDDSLFTVLGTRP
jgi:ubiquinone/menaquinone biosynthesis C-methylase UbiE